ncbi:MAG: ABC transporter ATP-binding protein [Thermoleophilia bacterium]|nr:ABC transporter ATP-binding protein [Thermoleophilia bacterium]
MSPTSPEAQHLVSLSGVTKTVHVGLRRRPVTILRGVDLAVEHGDVFGLIGPNGAGKTTTVKVLLGLMAPSGGSVDLRLRGLGAVGYLPENPYFYDYLSGREFLSFCARLFGLGAGERKARADRLLRDVGLEAAADVHLRKYSKGMLQRIGIAQALINDPHLVLLDEPMTGLDPIGRLEVKRIIQRLHDEGRTVLFNSHILADVEELCTRIAVMKGGRIVWGGTVAEALTDSPEGLEAFFMRVVGDERPGVSGDERARVPGGEPDEVAGDGQPEVAAGETPS